MNRSEISIMRAVAVALMLSVSGTALDAQAQAPQGTWSQAGQLTTERNEIGSALLNGKLYVVGGAALGRQDSPLVQEFDLATSMWRDLASLPKGASHVMAATLNGKIYVAGGFTANVHRNPLDQFVEFDPATNQWRNLAPLSSPRGAVGLVSLAGKVHAVGGRGPDGRTVGTHEVYDPATSRWTPAAPLPLARDHLGIAVLNGEIHVFGGRTGATVDNVARHDVYDPSTDRWREAAPLITARSAGAATVYRGQIVYFGGECKNPQARMTFDEMEAYDPTSNRWTSLAKPSSGLHASTAAVVGESVYFVGGTGGCGGDRPSRTIQAFRLP